MRKTILVVLLVVMFASLSACTIEWDGEQGQVTTKLTAISSPQISKIENDIVYWNSVSNADAYIISMNNNEARTTDLFYPISGLISTSCQVTVKVKAKGNGILYSDSEWSSVMIVDYVVPNNSGGEDDDPVVPTEKLSTPINLRVEDGVIKWDEVENAETYTVVINNDYDNEYITRSLICEVAQIANKSGLLSIKVRANSTAAHNASDWCEPVEYNYVAHYDDEELISKLENYGIGAGYNFYEDPYLETGGHLGQLVFDVAKLLSTGKYRVTEGGISGGSVLNYSSVQDYLDQTEVYVDFSNDAKVNILGKVKARVQNSFGLETDNKHTYYEYKNNYVYTWTQPYGSYSIGNFPQGIDSLADCLSVSFLNLLNSDKSIEEKCEEIYTIYGTHALLGIQMGGTFTATFQVKTTKEDTANKLKLNYQQGVTAEFFKGIAKGASNLGVGVDKESHQYDENTVTSLETLFYGGESVPSFTLEGLEDTIIEWGKSINAGSNIRSLGVSDNGGAVSIVTLLELIDTDLATAYEQYLDERYQTVLDEVISKYDDKWGTAEEPIQIGSIKEFIYYLETYSDYPWVHYQLTKDIDLKDWGESPIQVFNGTLDGNGHKILNWNHKRKIDLNDATDDQRDEYGLICANYGTIKNLIMEDCNLSLEHIGENQISVGALVGVNYGTIENCYINNLTLSVTHEYNGNVIYFDKYYNAFAGGIAGFNSKYEMETGEVDNKGEKIKKTILGEIKNCHIEASTIDCTVKHSVELTSVTKYWAKAGGIAGINDGNITACYANKNAITASAGILFFEGNNGVAAAGGITGYNRAGATISYSFAHGNKLTSVGSNDYDYKGQLCGQHYGVLINVAYLSDEKVYNDRDPDATGIPIEISSPIEVVNILGHGWHLVGTDEVSPFTGTSTVVENKEGN